MNLIEQLGGYEKLKEMRGTTQHALLAIGGCDVIHVNDVDLMLLEHRRANNIFEVGDFVVLKDGNCTLMYSLYERIGDYVYLKRPSGREFDFRLQDIRHATPQEIKAGHRL